MPNTEISLGSNYTAEIEDCPVSKLGKRYWIPPTDKQIYSLGVQDNISNDIKVDPNLTTSSFTIDVGSESIDNWELFDLSGKRVLQG